jgi:hypothetical protein
VPEGLTDNYMKIKKCDDCGNELLFPQRIITDGQLKTLCFYCSLRYLNRKKIRPLEA